MPAAVAATAAMAVITLFFIVDNCCGRGTPWLILTGETGETLVTPPEIPSGKPEGTVATSPPCFYGQERG